VGEYTVGMTGEAAPEDDAEVDVGVDMEVPYI
jgi:hypothetical protein